MENLIVACILSVTTPQGEICIKPDGKIEFPTGVELDKLSHQFWDEVAKVYLIIKAEKCI